MTPDAPGATPAERRAVLAREIQSAQQAGWRAPHRLDPLPADPVATRGELAIDDAEHIRDLVHAGRTEEAGALVCQLAAGDRRRLVGLVVGLAAAVPAEPIEGLLAWVTPFAPQGAEVH